MNNQSKPGPIEPEGTCGICHKESIECVGVRHICEACHADGWREGAEMFSAIEKDPNFVIHKDGKLGYVPDDIVEWGKS